MSNHLIKNILCVSVLSVGGASVVYAAPTFSAFSSTEEKPLFFEDATSKTPKLDAPQPVVNLKTPPPLEQKKLVIPAIETPVAIERATQQGGNVSNIEQARQQLLEIEKENERARKAQIQAEQDILNRELAARKLKVDLENAIKAERKEAERLEREARAKAKADEKAKKAAEWQAYLDKQAQDREAKRQAKIQAEQERKAKAEREAQLKAEAKLKAEQDRAAKIKADEELKAEGKRKAEEKRKAEADLKAQLKAEADRKAEEERQAQLKAEEARQAQLKAEKDRQAQLKADAVRKAEEERQAKLKADADRKAEEERQAKLKADADRKAEEERQTKLKADAARKTEEDRQTQLKADAARKAQEVQQAQLKIEADVARKLESDRHVSKTINVPVVGLGQQYIPVQNTSNTMPVQNAPLRPTGATALQRATSMFGSSVSTGSPIRQQLLGYAASQDQIKAFDTRYKYDSSRMAVLPKQIASISLNSIVKLNGDQLNMFRTLADKRAVEEYMAYHPLHAEVFSNYIKRIMTMNGGMTNGITVDQALMQEITFDLGSMHVPSASMSEAPDQYLYITSRLTDNDQAKFWNWVNAIRTGNKIEVPTWVKLVDVMYSH